MPSRNPLLWLATVIALTLFTVQAVTWWLADWMWFDAAGRSEIFLRLWAARLASGGLVALVLATAVRLSGSLALRNTHNRPVVLHGDATGPVQVWLRDPEALRGAVTSATFAAALVGGLLGADQWEEWVAWWYRIPFPEHDPVLGLGIGFYVHVLPLLETVRFLGMFVVLAALAVAGGVYVTRGAIGVLLVEDEAGRSGPKLHASEVVRRHMASLAAAFVALVAIGYHLQRFHLMYAPGQLFDGPGYTAVNAVLPLLLAQAISTALAVILVFQGIASDRGGLISWAVLLVVPINLASGAIPWMVQRFQVEPNELERERVFLQEHIRETRRAWGLDRVQERALSGNATLSWEDIEANGPTLRNVRLWDHEPLLATFRELQEIRTYYQFASVDNDRYLVDGELRQTMLSPRELLPDRLDEDARTWVNERLVYTHGYGMALGPVNEVSSEGLPLLWVQDLPPSVQHPDPLRIDQAAIYYGERMPDGVFVNTRAKEFDHPTADGQAYATYEGLGGVQVGSFIRRLILAGRMRELDVLLADDLAPGSRVLLYRNIAQRVASLAPFLHIDPDPYMVIVDGRLVWLVDAYTTSAHYPYAAHRNLRVHPDTVSFPTTPDKPPVESVNYVRNSVKATVDAYDGTVHLYALDEADPVLATWRAAFPGLIEDDSAMPPGIRAHLRVPTELFSKQAELFSAYHMTDSGQFYNREDDWAVPTWVERDADDTPQQSQPTQRGRKTDEHRIRMEPYYTVMKLPDEDREEFIVMLPFSPRGKQNLSAWMVARSDGDGYGELRVYRFPKDRMVFGPGQIAHRIAQDDQISAMLTLWSKGTSKVEQGTLLVIPVEESLLYVQPLYLRSAAEAIPELKRVIVAYKRRITMAPTLEGAVRKLFEQSTPTERDPTQQIDDAPRMEQDEFATDATQPMPTGDWRALAGRAARDYADAQRASQEGRWADYGEALRRLGRTLDALQVAEGVPEQAPPPPP